MPTDTTNPSGWDRVAAAVELVRVRLHRFAESLEDANISYMVIGECAVAAQVAEVEEEAVRNTPSVDFVLKRDDFALAKTTLAAAGFECHVVNEMVLFADIGRAEVNHCVRVYFEGERVNGRFAFTVPEIVKSVRLRNLRVVELDTLVRVLLESHRTINRVNLRDLMDVGLIDASWLPKLPDSLAVRLKILLDDPEG